MKRTNSRKHFFVQNRRLLLLFSLLLAGVGAGVAVYASFDGELPSSILTLLTISPVTDGLRGALLQLLSSCFQMFVLLAALFVSGLCALGGPVAVLMPLFWGVGLGLSLAHYYAQGFSGVLLCASVLLLPALPKAVALLIGCTQSLQMSTQMLCQLLPHGARCGGLWQSFRAYCLRFLLLLPLLLLAGGMDVGLRALLLRFFPVLGG